MSAHSIPSSRLRGQIVCGRRLAPVANLSCDVVVVGTGAGGSMVARELALAGLHVIAVERGGHALDGEAPSERSGADPSARTTDDLAITVLQGQGLGGSTIHNRNVCYRLPDPLLARWRAELGLELAGFEDDIDAVERLFGVGPTPDACLNRNHRVFQRGLEALGYRGGRLRHHVEVPSPGPAGTRTPASLLTEALDHEATLLAEVRVEEILVDEGRAVGVRGRALDPNSARSIGDVTVRARAVVLAASATGSAVLHARSRLPDPLGFAGRGLHLQPGAAVLGVHDERIEAWRGVPQAWECTEFLDHAPDADRRTWIVPAFVTPGIAAGMLPAFGEEHTAWMRRYAHLSAAFAVVRDVSTGDVTPEPGHGMRLRYRPQRSDREQLALGLREAGRILFAGGARQVVVPLDHLRTFDSPDALDALTTDDIRPVAPSLTSVHPLGTLRMARDASHGLVDERGRHLHVNDLWVADASLLPTSIGVPPLLTLCALGRRVARELASE